MHVTGGDARDRGGTHDRGDARDRGGTRDRG